MKKQILPLFGLVFLTFATLGAQNKCCDALRGVTGLALIDLSNVNALNQFLQSPLPVSLSGSAFSVSSTSQCFKTTGVCLTIRDLSLLLGSVTNDRCCGGEVQEPIFNSFAEIIAQFDVTFEKPFKNKPTVTIDLETLITQNRCCPVGIRDASELCTGDPIVDCTNPPQSFCIGYINDMFIFLTDVTPNGFRVNFDIKVALNSVIDPVTGNLLSVLAAQNIISRGLQFHFHAIAQT